MNNAMVISQRLVMLILACASIVVFFAVEVHALDPERDLLEYMYRRWTAEDGMRQDTTTSIVQTHDGYLWVATQAGLLRFNGRVFEIYDSENTAGGLAGEFIEELHEDALGNLWIATNKGLSRYQDGVFTAYTTDDGLPVDDITSLASDANRLYIGARGRGIVVFDYEKFIPLDRNNDLPSLLINDLLFAKDGSLWIATKGGLARYREGQISVYTTERGLPHNEVVSLLMDSHNKLWIGTGLGACVMEKGDDCRQFDEQAIVPSHRIKTLFEDSGGNIWCGTDSEGLFRFGRGQFEVIAHQDGLDLDIETVMEDREGNLWVGTSGFGLFRIRDSKIYTFLPLPAVPSSSVWAVFEDNEGQMWYAAHKSLVMLDGETRRVFGAADGLLEDRIHAIAHARGGGVWVASRNGGVSRYRNGRFLHYHTRPNWPSMSLRSLWESADGVLWVGTLNQGVLLVDGGKIVDTINQDDGLPANRVSGIIPSKSGGVWLATQKGVVKYHDGRVLYPQSEGELPPVFTFGLHEDDRGNLWFGTVSSGLGLLKDGHFYFFGKERGLPTNVIYTAIDDSRGTIWCSSDSGIVKLNKKQLLEATSAVEAKVDAELFDSRDGMRNRETVGGIQSTALKTRDGRVMFCSVEGVAVVDPARFTRNEVAPPVVIEKVIADGNKIVASAALSPTTRRFDFDFAGLSYTAPEKILYKYKLEPIDTEWSEETHEASARYTTLDDGEYTFKVTAANDDGVWNDNETSFAFTVEPYWYERPVVLFLALLLSAGIIFLFVRRREQVITSRNQELSELAWKRTRKVLEEQVGAIRALISEATDVSARMQTLMGNMATSSDQVVAAVAETAVTVRHMEETSRGADQKANAIVEASDETKKVSKEGLASIDRSIKVMLRIKNESVTISADSKNLMSGIDEIDTIITMVQAISERSKILAINASIEAAKAGQAGSGFGVVAKRMKDLAIQSKASAQEINKLLERFRKSTAGIAQSAKNGHAEVESGAAVIVNSGEIVNLLTKKVENNAELADVISTSIVQQLTGFKQIVSAIDQISSSVEENTEMGQEISSSAARLDEAIEKLQSNIDEWETPEFYQELP